MTEGFATELVGQVRSFVERSLAEPKRRIEALERAVAALEEAATKPERKT